MKNILVPTDFSINAYDALFYATRLFKNQPCTFYILHTFEVPLGIINRDSDQAEKLKYDEAKKNSDQGLNEIKHRITRDCEDLQHSFKKLSISNSLIPTISRTIVFKNIDLVVMGTQGATGAKELFIGSNTVKVIQHIRQCSLLAVPAQMEHSNSLKIAFSTGLDHFVSKQELTPLIEIATIHESEIYILHIMEESLLSTLQKQNLERIKNHLKYNKNYVYRLPDRKSKVKVLSNFIEKEKINLLAMIRHENSFMEKLIKEPTIKKMGYHSKVPFLVMPEAW